MPRSKEAHIIAFTHFKGGTGKTTSALSIAGYLAKFGAKVLAVDLDPQANLSRGLGVAKIKARRSMHHVLAKQTSLNSIIVPTAVDKLSLAPASYQLTHTLMTGKKSATTLKTTLTKVAKHYDFILLDLPPSNGSLIVNGVLAAHTNVLVLDPGHFSLDGIESFQGSFMAHCKKLGFKPTVSMALVTKCQRSLNPFSTTRSKRIASLATNLLKKPVYQIPYSEHIYESQELSLPISHHRPRSRVGMAYLKVAKALLEL